MKFRISPHLSSIMLNEVDQSNQMISWCRINAIEHRVNYNDGWWYLDIIEPEHQTLFILRWGHLCR